MSIELKREKCLRCSLLKPLPGSDWPYPQTIIREYTLERFDALHMVKRYLECNHYDIWHDLEKNKDKKVDEDD